MPEKFISGIIYKTKKGDAIMSELMLEQISSLDKVFLTDNFKFNYVNSATVLKGDRYSFQVAYSVSDDNSDGVDGTFEVKSDISEYVKVYFTENVPSSLPMYPGKGDGAFEKREPGLFPDVLRPAETSYIKIPKAAKRGLWITVDVPEDAKAGKYEITTTVKCDFDEKSVMFTLEILDCVLPKYPFKYTQWFHTDCIADFYVVEVFSERHWELIEKFIKMAAYIGISMILTPIFTPPLDTEVGGERTTVQLVDVKKDGENYSFGFDKLRRWIDICKRCGIEYYEMAHLFTQWGAYHAPKIIADVNGEEKRIFGWDTDFSNGDYANFLKCFIPELIAVLEEEKIDKCTYFHISDEPFETHLESYTKARNMIIDLTKGFPIMDALSDYEFYKKGLTEIPVPSVDHIAPFVENPPKERWTYYCCCQFDKVTNRFFSMPSSRNRIGGTQFYKYEIEGFLQWGYNFYSTQLSRRKINPFMITDADMAFASGDAFSVYPGENEPLESLRAEVFADGLRDMRAYMLLESLTDRQTVLDMINFEGEVTFTEYPTDASYLLELREKVNRKIADKMAF